MKRISALAILLFQLCHYGYSQDEINFKISYKDSTQYNIVVEKAWHSETTYAGPDDFLLKLRGEGKDNPTYTDEEHTNKFILRTGQLNEDERYPLTLELVNVANEFRQSIPNGTLVYGHGSLDMMPHFDSIASKVIGDHQLGFQLAKIVFPPDTIPAKKLRQGEEFSVVSSYFESAGGTILNLEYTTIYSFTGIAGGVANFDISETYTVKPRMGTYEYKAEGKGSGSIEYDVANNVLLEYQKDTELDITIDLYNGRSAETKSTTHYKRTVEVATN